MRLTSWLQLMRASVELAKEWRSDKYLRRALNAVLVVADKCVRLMAIRISRCMSSDLTIHDFLPLDLHVPGSLFCALCSQSTRLPTHNSRVLASCTRMMYPTMSTMKIPCHVCIHISKLVFAETCRSLFPETEMCWSTRTVSAESGVAGSTRNVLLLLS